jgi:phage antirepressor YoqD-like protein
MKRGPITQDNFKSLVSGGHGEPTMSSREIAELVQSRHDSVKRTIERCADKKAITLPPLVETSFVGSDGRSQSVSIYNLCKRDSLIVVAQLCPEFTARIVDRWQELEEMAAKPMHLIPQTLSEALRLAADQAEVIERQSIALAIAAPKVEFVDHYVDSTGLKGFREVAKLLKIKEPEFRCFLRDNNIMYRLGGDWVAYQNHINAGRFAVKAGVSNHSDHAFSSCKFTPKGVEWIAGVIAAHGVRRELEPA